MRDTFPPAGAIRCATTEETQAWGACLGQALEAGDLVILSGPLGAGKTTLTQGIARGMGVRGRVTSPTFIIAREHRAMREGGPTLLHIDAYRLLGENIQARTADPWGELDALDLDSDLDESVVVAEWGAGVVDTLAGRYLAITIDRNTAVRDDPSSEARIITWSVQPPQELS